jgi:hypothetical protein
MGCYLVRVHGPMDQLVHSTQQALAALAARAQARHEEGVGQDDGGEDSLWRRGNSRVA